MRQDAWDEAKMRSLFSGVCNWGRWGKDDELGALNFITPEKRREAARMVRDGRSVSLARDFPTIPAPDNPHPALHLMVNGGDDCCVSGIDGLETSSDFIGIAFHGFASTHIDALCHTFVDGKMYNGIAAEEVKSTGARKNAILAVKHGIVGRGVLLDIPLALGLDHVPPDRMIGIEELQLAEKSQGVTVDSGDILIVRMGRDVKPDGAARSMSDVKMAGLHPEVLPWLHEREIAALGGDGVQDPVGAPPSNTVWPMPIHACGIVSIGLHLLDNLYLEDLAELARELDRWAFHICVSPLRIAGGTGSPVNPIASF